MLLIPESSCVWLRIFPVRLDIAERRQPTGRTNAGTQQAHSGRMGLLCGGHVFAHAVLCLRWCYVDTVLPDDGGVSVQVTLVNLNYCSTKKNV